MATRVVFMGNLGVVLRKVEAVIDGEAYNIQYSIEYEGRWGRGRAAVTARYY